MIRDLKGTIKSHIDNFETQLFTALPATIISFDATEQTATVAPVMLEPYTDGIVAEIAEIDHVPVVFPSAGGGSLTFPVKVGDEVLLIFSSRNYDTWWDTGEVKKLPSTRRFNDLTDAVAIIGITSKGKSVNANTEDVELKFNNNSILLKADGNIEVTTNSKFSVTNPSEELISLLSEIVDEVSKITTNTVYGISPINNKAAVSALKARLDTFKN